jgi:hypothetical protein
VSDVADQGGARFPMAGLYITVAPAATADAIEEIAGRGP